MFFEVKMQQDNVSLMPLQPKMQKTENITYLETNKQQTRYHLTYSDLAK